MSTITLKSGRQIDLRELRQAATNEGWLAGYPNAADNQRELERLAREHRDNPYPGPPYLIEPVATPGDGLGFVNPRRGAPSYLPAVTCVARFTSSQPARDELAHFSGLIVIWFQSEFALPIDPLIRTAIEQMDWNHLAADLTY